MENVLLPFKDGAAPGVPFHGRLHRCIDSLQICASQEVSRLEHVIESLREENQKLVAHVRSQDHGAENIAADVAYIIADGQAKAYGAYDSVLSKESRETPRKSPRSLRCVRGKPPPVVNETSPHMSSSHSPAFSSEDNGSAKRNDFGMDKSHSATSKGLSVDKYKIRDTLSIAGRIQGELRTNKYHDRGLSQQIVRSAAFDQLTLIIIVMNAVWISVDLDLNEAPTLLEADPIFQIMENMFCLFFTVEFSIRLFAHAPMWKCLYDKWFVFDGFLLAMMIGETWLMTAIMAMTGMKSTSVFANASVLRLLRLLRLTRMARMLRAMPELLIIVKGMLAGIRSVSITSVLLGAVTYIFSIIFRQMTVGTKMGEDVFPNIPYSFYHLVVEAMFPDNGAMFERLFAESFALGMLFFVFLFFSALTFMNMLIGILCDVVSTVSSEGKTQIEIDNLTVNMKTLLAGIDDNNDGLVSRVEMQHILDNDSAIRSLQAVGVDIESLVDDVDYIFMDGDGGTVEQLDFRDFLDIILQFRANTTTTVRNIAGLRKLVRNNDTTMRLKLDSIERVLFLLKEDARRNRLSLTGSQNGTESKPDFGIGVKSILKHPPLTPIHADEESIAMLPTALPTASSSAVSLSAVESQDQRAQDDFLYCGDAKSAQPDLVGPTSL